MKLLRILTGISVTLFISSGFWGCGEPDSDLIQLSDNHRAKSLKVLRAGLRSVEFWPSMHAAEGLTLGGYGNEVVTYLEPKLLGEMDDQKRCGLARELVRAGKKEYVQVMLDILASDDPHGHVHAAESLYKVGELGDGSILRRRYKEMSNVTLKIMAAAALGRGGNPEAMAYLRDQLNHSDLNIVRIAGWVLARIGNEKDIPALQRARDNADLDLQRVFHQHSLAALGDEEGLQSLLANLSSDDAVTRTYSATFAGDARALEAKDQLIVLLDDENLDTRIRAAQSLLALSTSPTADHEEDIANLVYTPTDENPRYTEGSVLELNDGSLLFAITEFFDSGSDFAKAHIIARRSEDCGLSWSEPRILQKNTGGLNCMSVTLRRLPTPDSPQRIALFYLQKNSHSDLDLYVKYSNDEAKSFGDAILVTDMPGYHVVNNDRVTQLSTGRLLAPAASTPDVTEVNHFESRCFISDDQGQSWRAGKEAVDLPQRGAMEPEVIELQDGRVMMIIRNQLGTISKAHSTDGGETWSEPSSLGPIAPEAPATLRRIPSTGDLLLIWNKNVDPGASLGGKRTPLNVAISKDEGESWILERELETDPNFSYSYPSLTFIRNRAVLTYWVEDSSKRQWSTKFRSLPISWFYR